jgi:hypothetical protein
MSLSFTPYASDEDVAVRAPSDFQVLCPKDVRLASGTDGVFTMGSPWVLSSASNTFDAQGVVAGSVVSVCAPGKKDGGRLYAVDSAAGSTVTLRNLGMLTGDGMPPGPAAGATGIVFAVPTLAPQIANACLDTNDLFGIDPALPLRSPKFVYDPAKQLKRYVCLLVLVERYADETRTDKGDFARKLTLRMAEVTELRERMRVQWGALGKQEQPTSLWDVQVRR